MPRYASQNLANFDSESNRMAGGSTQRRRHNFGKQVIIASGNKIVGDGLCLRLLPTYDVDENGSRTVDEAGNPVLASFFLNNDPAQGFGDWQRLYECVHFFGHPAVSFIVWDGNGNIDRWKSPAWLLYNASNEVRKHEIGGEIGRLFAELRNTKDGYGSNSHVGSLKAPQPLLFISASQLLARPDGSVGLSVFEEQERNARIFGFTKTAMQSFYNALRVENEAGEPMCGDLLASGPAKLVTIMPTGYGRGQRLPKPPALSTEGPDYVFVPSYATPVDPNEVVVLGKPNPTGHADGGKSHSVVLHDNFMQHQVDLHAYAQQITNENVTFDEMMYVPTFGEQAEIMADAFPREALDYAWRDYPEYLSALPTGRTTVQAPQARAATPPPPAPKAAPAPVSWEEVEAADDMEVAPVPQATIPPPPKPTGVAPAVGAAAALAAAKAKARATQKRS